MSTRMKFFVCSLVGGHTMLGAEPECLPGTRLRLCSIIDKRRCGCYRISPIQGAFVSPSLLGFFYS